jgi:uncharacterized protein (TIGR02646 family)
MIYIQKSQPAPECLAQQKDYKCGDVIPRLKADFHNKCYLCEDKGITSINVEHFIPHRGDKNLMYDWDNLFYSCGHCNNTKLAIPKFNNILNCTEYNNISITTLVAKPNFSNSPIYLRIFALLGLVLGFPRGVQN